MVETFEALAVLFVAVLPGAAYSFVFEKVVGGVGRTLQDRLVRFVGASAALHAIGSWATYQVYAGAIASGDLAAGRASATAVWAVGLAYLGVPGLLGGLVGVGFRRRWRWIRYLVRGQRHPRAWDHLWAANPEGYVRIKLKSGPWTGGWFGRRGDDKRPSYAAPYPEPSDLFVATGFLVDADSGEFILDGDGQPVPTGYGLLVRWDEVELLELMEA